MDVESVMELAVKYARYTFPKEEQIIYDEFVKFETKLTYDEYVTWFKSNFENYFTIICIMWKGDEERIETQIQDDYLSLCNYYNEFHSVKMSEDLEKQLDLKDMISFAVYFCEYRIQHLTYDSIMGKESLCKVHDNELEFYRRRKRKWLSMYDNLMQKIETTMKNQVQ